MGKTILILLVLILIAGCSEEISKKELTESAGGEQKVQIPFETEIRVKQAGVEMVIAPSQDGTISGVVSIRAVKVPEGTGAVAFVIQGEGIPSMNIVGPNLGIDNEGSDGWQAEFDTSVYDNGEYTLLAVAVKEGAGEGTPPLGGAQAEVIIDNSQQTSLEAPTISSYKAVHLWEPHQNMERIREAKELGANIIIINLFLDHKEGKVVLPEGWERYLQSSVNEAYRNGLAASIAVDVPSEYSKSLPYREGSGIDFPSGYKLGLFAENMAEIYQELAIFAERNQLHSLVVPAELEEWVGRVFEDGEEYWEETSKVDQRVIREIKKHYQGKIIGELIGASFGFGMCCYTNIPLDKINFNGYDALAFRTRSDYQEEEAKSEKYDLFVEEIFKAVDFLTDNFGIEEIYLEVGGCNWAVDKAELYNLIFTEISDKVDGYSINYLVRELWKDSESFEAAKVWFKKL